jgi:oxygen-independent coproporphyrinogen-3 oxidase
VSGAAHLYVHLPFCASRCGYCAFVVKVGALGRRDAYLAALLAELEREAERLGPLETVYLGGGTPTLMRADRLARIMDAVRPHLAPGAEVTVEANPETVESGMLAALVESGVTRLSLGVQSLDPGLLRALDRAATPEQALRAAECARAAGIASLSVDMLLAVPGQRPEALRRDIEGVLAIAPEHVSWYELEIKLGTALERMGVTPPDEDAAADAYREVVDSLEAAGYRWYETANFARPGHECRHSLAYWGAADYLGVGVGAVSTIDGRRWRNTTSLEAYVAADGSPARTVEPLDEDTRRRERWMLGLRLDRPLTVGWAGPPDHPEAIDRLAGWGLLEREGDAVALTREGRFLQNAVLHELMEYA